MTHEEILDKINDENHFKNLFTRSDALKAMAEAVSEERERTIETLWVVYKEKGGYTNTASSFIEKITGQKWERDKEYEELKKQLAAKDKEHKEIVEDLECRLSNLRGAKAIQDKEIESTGNAQKVLMVIIDKQNKEIAKLKEDVRLLNLPIVKFIRRQIKKQDNPLIP